MFTEEQLKKIKACQQLIGDTIVKVKNEYNLYHQALQNPFQPRQNISPLLTDQHESYDLIEQLFYLSKFLELADACKDSKFDKYKKFQV